MEENIRFENGNIYYYDGGNRFTISDDRVRYHVDYEYIKDYASSFADLINETIPEEIAEEINEHFASEEEN